MSDEPQTGAFSLPLRDPVAVIADYLGQFGPDPQTLVRWLHDEGLEITAAHS